MDNNIYITILYYSITNKNEKHVYVIYWLVV